MIIIVELVVINVVLVVHVCPVLANVSITLVAIAMNFAVEIPVSHPLQVNIVDRALVALVVIIAAQDLVLAIKTILLIAEAVVMFVTLMKIVVAEAVLILIRAKNTAVHVTIDVVEIKCAALARALILPLILIAVVAEFRAVALKFAVVQHVYPHLALAPLSTTIMFYTILLL